jgi:predicted nucleic acid-binding protein
MNMIDKIAIDTNVLVYSISQDEEEKRQKSIALIQNSPLIFHQNLSEFINIISKRWKFSKERTIQLTNEILKDCILATCSSISFQNAQTMISKYDFQIFDALIVAAAIENNCTILYTEDMQHNMKVENKLNIVNPFLI